MKKIFESTSQLTSLAGAALGSFMFLATSCNLPSAQEVAKAERDARSASDGMERFKLELRNSVVSCRQKISAVRRPRDMTVGDGFNYDARQLVENRAWIDNREGILVQHTLIECYTELGTAQEARRAEDEKIAALENLQQERAKLRDIVCEEYPADRVCNPEYANSPDFAAHCYFDRADLPHPRDIPAQMDGMDCNRYEGYLLADLEEVINVWGQFSMGESSWMDDADEDFTEAGGLSLLAEMREKPSLVNKVAKSLGLSTSELRKRIEVLRKISNEYKSGHFDANETLPIRFALLEEIPTQKK